MPARPADRRHQRGGADRRRAGPRARSSRSISAPLIEQLVASWEQRRETGNVRIAFARPRRGERDRHRRAGPAGARDRQYHRQCDQLLAARRAGRDRRDPCRRRGPDPDRRRRARACPTKRARRSSIASTRSGPKARVSAAIRGSALRSPGRSSKAMTARSTCSDRDDAPSGARFTITPAGRPTAHDAQ